MQQKRQRLSLTLSRFIGFAGVSARGRAAIGGTSDVLSIWYKLPHEDYEEK